VRRKKKREEGENSSCQTRRGKKVVRSGRKKGKKRGGGDIPSPIFTHLFGGGEKRGKERERRDSIHLRIVGKI